MHAHSARFTQSEDALQKLAESIAAYWEPLRTWTPVALLLSKNANILAASSTAALALVIPVEALKKRNKKVEKKLAYSKIADEDKRILTALGNLQRKNLSTLYDLKIDLSDIETAAQHFGEIWQRALATSQQLIIAFILQTTSRTQPEISSCT